MSIIAKYKFDKTIYADLLPEFNAEFTPDKYNTTDEVDSENSNYIIRTIESDSLPTLMRFGRAWVNGEADTDNRTDSLLEVLDMNVSPTDCSSMFRHCRNLISIDLSDFDTTKVTNMADIFSGCLNLTSLDVSNFVTSNVTTMHGMFYNCKSLTELDVSGFDTSKVTDMYGVFHNCSKLTSLNLSGFDTTNVTMMQYMFCNCSDLTSLDVSNFNTVNVTNMFYMFQNCPKLTVLDLSSFDTAKVTDINNIFTSTPLLTDIGMLYCNQSTINKIASLLPADTTQTIWVEDVDIKDLTSVEGVEFKQYAKNTEIMLTSPLLEGDKLIVKDGKLYHYHKMGKVVLDGSEDWKIWSGNFVNVNRYYIVLNKHANSFNVLCSVFPNLLSGDCELVRIGGSYMEELIIHSKYITLTEFKQWLQNNPTTAVYELAEPYYELISEDPLDISLISETVDITNSSNIPLNMTINNKGLSTIAMSPSTTYTVAFDKDTDSEVVVNLCGNEVTTSNNVVEITTPSEIDDELIFYGDGVEISNVRLLEGSVSGDSIPRESFEGLKNSFEDGYIPNLIPIEFSRLESGNINSNTGANIDNPDIVRTPLLTVTSDKITFAIVNANYTLHKVLLYDSEGNYVARTIEDIDYLKLGVVSVPEGCSQFRLCFRASDVSVINQSNLFILEGDWTHLTEEDWNNLGKYKVEYKVTGKNKFDRDKFIVHHAWQCTYEFLSDGGIKVAPTTTNGVCFLQIKLNSKMLSERKIYNYKPNIQKSTENINAYTSLWNGTDVTSHVSSINDLNNLNNFSLGLYIDNSSLDNYAIFYPQIEEGTIPTEYEPYKEFTKTFYLNSPLLEGDTIEDINGVATHIKRYEKVVLDGSENWKEYKFYTDTSAYSLELNNSKISTSVICDRFANYGSVVEEKDPVEGISLTGVLRIRIFKSKLSSQYLNGFKQWLQANPITVVYELASPIYETISTESILCDSYVNGHLDVDTNIPIEKVEFQPTSLALKYLVPNKNYKVQLDSDSEGSLAWGVGGHSNGINENIVKGKNVLNVITVDKLNNDRLYMTGIGFNASNIQVVATDRNADFGYFKGLQSSFESELVADEADENYGKYKVECIVTNEDNSEMYTKTIYLNSPLLKGDTIEVHNGKLCHYHKMGMIVLDGSEGWEIDFVKNNTITIYDSTFMNIAKPATVVFCNKFPHVETLFSAYDSEAIKMGSIGLYININKSKLSTLDIDGFKQWLQTNPTTVVYELAKPYYEEITPTQEDLIITSVKEGDLHIDTIVPISSKVTYNVNVQLLTDFEQSIVEQVQVTQTTDLQSILDEEIDN